MHDPQLGAGRRAYAVIERQVDHMMRLVDDLLDVSRIETMPTTDGFEIVAEVPEKIDRDLTRNRQVDE